MDEWQARDGWVYGRDGEDSICKAMRRRDGGGTLIDEKVIAEQIAREHNALATARAHVEALVEAAEELMHSAVVFAASGDASDIQPQMTAMAEENDKARRWLDEGGDDE